jgi:hypothetical protein
MVPINSSLLNIILYFFFFFFQALNFLVESFCLLNDLLPFPSILNAGYPDLQLADVLFDVILLPGLSSVLKFQDANTLFITRIPLHSLLSASIYLSGSVPPSRVFSLQMFSMDG